MQHDHGDDEQVDALDHRIVALVDGVEEEPPHAGQPEDRLDDHRAAEIWATWMPSTVTTGMMRVLAGCA